MSKTNLRELSNILRAYMATCMRTDPVSANSISSSSSPDKNMELVIREDDKSLRPEDGPTPKIDAK